LEARPVVQPAGQQPEPLQLEPQQAVRLLLQASPVALQRVTEHLALRYPVAC
jgi:hypothetical protein